MVKPCKNEQNPPNPSKIAIALKKLCLVKNDKPASYKKDWNYIIKTLVNVNKGGTFAPATPIDVHWNTDKHTNLTEKFFSKKDSKKLVRFENGCYICTPQTKFTEHFFR